MAPLRKSEPPRLRCQKGQGRPAVSPRRPRHSGSSSLPRTNTHTLPETDTPICPFLGRTGHQATHLAPHPEPCEETQGPRPLARQHLWEGDTRPALPWPEWPLRVVPTMAEGCCPADALGPLPPQDKVPLTSDGDTPVVKVGQVRPFLTLGARMGPT